MDTKEKLSTLWIVVMFNLIFADVLSIITELVNKNVLDIIGEVTIVMAIAAVLTNIPILMIFFSKSLPHQISRIMNLVAASITIVFVVGGGSLLPHYIICAGIEVIALLLIFRMAWRWKEPSTING